MSGVLESIRIRPGTGTLVWTSEGEKSALRLTNPFVREMNSDGTYVGEFDTPAKFFTTAVPDTTTGIRNNLAFAVCITPVPEPSTWVAGGVVAAGAIGIAARRRARL